jgi:Sulfotransferase domain
LLPNLIIIGAPKAGTSSLHSYLQRHPEVAMSIPKELSYFWREDWREQRAQYEAKFDFPDNEVRVRGESTPFYTSYPFRANVPERMHELVPDVRLIYVVRDPIERLLSHWVQRAGDGDRTPFERYMEEYDTPDNRIVCPSRYWLQIERYMNLFDRSQLLVIDQHDLRVRRRETLREVFRFVEVDDSFDSPQFEVEVNTRDQKLAPGQLGAQVWDRVLRPASRLAPERVRSIVNKPVTRLLYRQIKEPVLAATMRERLRTMLAPEVQALRRFTGKEFETWSM